MHTCSSARRNISRTWRNIEHVNYGSESFLLVSVHRRGISVSIQSQQYGGMSPMSGWLQPAQKCQWHKKQEINQYTTFASKVLPVPGGPYKMTPLGGLIPFRKSGAERISEFFLPISSYNSGCVIGSSTASLISWICGSRPPMSAYVSSGA